MKLLSIVIPTYNRKERLFQQLKSITSQKVSDKVDILICDNCSPYSVDELVSTEFVDAENIEVVSNKYNIGGGANIAMTFLRCRTKWMWLLGDDDETTEDSIETILEDIEAYPDVAYFKYSIKGFPPYKEKSVESIEDYIDYYHFGENYGGDMIFISNNVYNLDIIGPCFKNTLMQSFFRLPHLMPVFNFLIERQGKVMFRPKAIVIYQKPEPGTAWNMIDVSVGIASLHLGNLKIDKKHYKRLMMKIGSGFSHRLIVNQCLVLPNRQQAIHLYHYIYKHLIFPKCSFKHICIYILFHILILIRNIIKIKL